MTPHRSHGRGSYIIDRVFDDELGRIRLASGTKDPETFKAIDAMLTTFWHTGRHDLLREIRDGKLRPVTVFGWFRQGRLDRLPTGELLRPLQATWEAWARSLECSPGHRKDLGTTLRALEVGAHPISDAARLFQGLTERKAGHATTIRKAKMNLLAFLRDTVGVQHALYQDVKAARIGRVTVERKGRPLATTEIHALLQRLPSDAAAMVWSMCALGTLPKEYWGVWRVLPDRIEIDGTKRKGRRRSVPHWTPVVRPLMGARKLARLVSAASGDAVLLKDFRNTFSRWLEEAGVVRSHRSAYLGHGGKTMTEYYELGELPGQFAADAAKLLAYVPSPAPTLRLLHAEGA